MTSIPSTNLNHSQENFSETSSLQSSVSLVDFISPQIPIKKLTKKEVEKIRKINNPKQVKLINNEQLEPTHNNHSHSTQNLRVLLKNIVVKAFENYHGKINEKINKGFDFLQNSLQGQITHFAQALASVEESPALYKFKNIEKLPKIYEEIQEFCKKIPYTPANPPTMEDIRKIEKLLHSSEENELFNEFKLHEMEWKKSVDVEQLIESLKNNPNFMDFERRKGLTAQIKAQLASQRLNFSDQHITLIFDWISQPNHKVGIEEFIHDRNPHLDLQNFNALITVLVDVLTQDKIQTFIESSIAEANQPDLFIEWGNKEVIKMINQFTDKATTILQDMGDEAYQELFNSLVEIFHKQTEAEVQAKRQVDKVRKLFVKAQKIVVKKPKNSKEAQVKSEYEKFLRHFLERKPSDEAIEVNEEPNQTDEESSGLSGETSSSEAKTNIDLTKLSQAKLDLYCEKIYEEAYISAFDTKDLHSPVLQLTKQIFHILSPQWEEKGLLSFIEQSVEFPDELKKIHKELKFFSEQFLQPQTSDNFNNFIENEVNTLKEILFHAGEEKINEYVSKEVHLFLEKIADPENITNFINKNLLPSINSSLIEVFAHQVVDHNLDKTIEFLIRNSEDENLNRPQVLGFIKNLLTEQSQLFNFNNDLTDDQFEKILTPLLDKLEKALKISGSNRKKLKESLKLLFREKLHHSSDDKNYPSFGNIIANLSEIVDLPPFIKWILKQPFAKSLLNTQLNHALSSLSTQPYGLINIIVNSIINHDEKVAIEQRIKNKTATEEDYRRIEQLKPVIDQGVVELTKTEAEAIRQKKMEGGVTEEELRLLEKYNHIQASKTVRIAQDFLSYATGKALPLVGRPLIKLIFGRTGAIAKKAFTNLGNFFRSRLRNKGIMIEMLNTIGKKLLPHSDIAPASPTGYKTDWRPALLPKKLDLETRIGIGIASFGLSEIIILIIKALKSHFTLSSRSYAVMNMIDQMAKAETLAREPHRLTYHLEYSSLNNSFIQASNHSPSEFKISSKIEPVIKEINEFGKNFFLRLTQKFYEKKCKNILNNAHEYLKGIKVKNFTKFFNTLGTYTDPQSGIFEKLLSQSGQIIYQECFNRFAGLISSANAEDWQKNFDQSLQLVDNHLTAEMKSLSEVSSFILSQIKHLILKLQEEENLPKNFNLNDLEQRFKSFKTLLQQELDQHSTPFFKKIDLDQLKQYLPKIFTLIKKQQIEIDDLDKLIQTKEAQIKGAQHKYVHEIANKLISFILPGNGKNPYASYEIIFQKLVAQEEVTQFLRNVYSKDERKNARFKDLIKSILIPYIHKKIRSFIEQQINKVIDKLSNPQALHTFLYNKLYPLAFNTLARISIKNIILNNPAYLKEFDLLLANVMDAEASGNPSGPSLMEKVSAFLYDKCHEAKFFQNIDTKPETFSPLTPIILRNLFQEKLKRHPKVDDLISALHTTLKNADMNHQDYHLTLSNITQLALPYLYPDLIVMDDDANSSEQTRIKNENILKTFNDIFSPCLKSILASTESAKLLPSEEEIDAEITKILIKEFKSNVASVDLELDLFSNFISTILKAGNLNFAATASSYSSVKSRINPHINPLLLPLRKSFNWIFKLLPDLLKNNLTDQIIEGMYLDKKEKNQPTPINSDGFNDFTQILFNLTEPEGWFSRKLHGGILGTTSDIRNSLVSIQTYFFENHENFKTLLLTLTQNLVNIFDNPASGYQEVFANHSIEVDYTNELPDLVDKSQSINNTNVHVEEKETASYSEKELKELLQVT